ATLDDMGGSIKGGEEQALKMIEMTLSIDYNEENDYNLISPYIANGAISPAFYYHKIKEHYTPSNRKKYDRLLMRLLWRDYFRFMLKKYSNIFFKPNDADKRTWASKEDLCTFMKNTKQPVIEKLFRELQNTVNLPYDHRDILAAYML